MDDSTDETPEKIKAFLSSHTFSHVRIHHIRRSSREGYKAGALRYGMRTSKGDYLAIFDADHVPMKDFLLRCMSGFRSKEVGFVQARWGFLNESASILTRVQAFLIHAHHAVEHLGRMRGGYFTNFDGAAGIWRRTCIDEAGGWATDTLIEDADLAYRAQLKGWRYVYLYDLVCMTELPNDMLALRHQQYRWNKGGAQCTRKLLGKMWRSRFPFWVKVYGTANFANASVSICIFLSSIFSVWMVYEQPFYSELLSSFFLLPFAFLIYHYWVMARKVFPQKFWRYLLWNLLPFLSMSMSLSFSNTMALRAGFFQQGGTFLRTPKSGEVTNNVQGLRKTRAKGFSFRRRRRKFSLLYGIEFLLMLFFLFSMFLDVYVGNYPMLLFHGTLAVGYGINCRYTLLPYKEMDYGKA